MDKRDQMFSEVRRVTQLGAWRRKSSCHSSKSARLSGGGVNSSGLSDFRHRLSFSDNVVSDTSIPRLWDLNYVQASLFFLPDNVARG